jgi:ABC-2 type transport system ATP-binding protein
MIAVSGLTRIYGDVAALDDVGFEVQPGHVCAYLGPNGAGKTTTVRILTGTLTPTAGRASVAGYDVVTQRDDVRRRIGYVPETGAVYMTLSATEYLAMAGALHRLPPAEIVRRSKLWLELFGVAAAADKRLDTLSKGMRQKVVLTAALLHDPDVLLLDEPLTGLDANAQHLFKDVLRGLAAQGKTILFCTHGLDIAERLCDQVIVLNRGRVVAAGDTAALMSARSKATLEAFFREVTASPEEPDQAERVRQVLGSRR